MVETFRGCTHPDAGFASRDDLQAGTERKKEMIENLAKEQLANTGHEELSLLSLSTSDYSQFEPLATDLMKMCGENNVSTHCLHFAPRIFPSRSFRDPEVSEVRTDICSGGRKSETS